MGEPGEQNHFTKSVAQTERERALKSAVTGLAGPPGNAGFLGPSSARAPPAGLSPQTARR